MSVCIQSGSGSIRCYSTSKQLCLLMWKGSRDSGRGS